MARVTKISKTTVPAAAAVPETVPKQKRIFPVIFVLVVLLALSVGIAGYFYYQYKHTAQVAQAEEIADLTKTIGAFMELPDGETPTLATVTDKDKLADQPFFRKAENGDKVLIYTQSGRAILYRPSVKKIVDVTVVNTSQSTAANAQQPAAEPSQASATETPVPVSAAPQNPTVALYNGSTKIGVTNSLEDQIKAKFPNISIVTKDKAAKNDYQDTVVVDLSGKNADLAKNIAESVGGTVGILPSGETAPQADVLVIVGNK